MEPIDLKQFKCIVESDDAHKRKIDPWHYQIPCASGHIYPYSDTLLAFYCSGCKTKQKIIRETDFEIIQDGDTEAVFLFTPKHFKLMSKYAKPRKRRRVSKERQKVLAKQGREALRSKNKHTKERVTASPRAKKEKYE